MRLITPKRLKENEEFMWRLADRQLDTFLARGRCEFISEYAGPFALLVIADLLGVPEADHPEFQAALLRRPDASAVGSVGDDTLGHATRVPLREVLGVRRGPTRRAEERHPHRTGHRDVPRRLDPEVIDVVRVAANVFAAGQETTVRLLSSAVKQIAEDPQLQKILRDDRARIPIFIEEMLRTESPVKGDFRLSRVRRRSAASISRRAPR